MSPFPFILSISGGFARCGLVWWRRACPTFQAAVPSLAAAFPCSFCLLYAEDVSPAAAAGGFLSPGGVACLTKRPTISLARFRYPVPAAAAAAGAAAAVMVGGASTTSVAAAALPFCAAAFPVLLPGGSGAASLLRIFTIAAAGGILLYAVVPKGSALGAPVAPHGLIPFAAVASAAAAGAGDSRVCRLRDGALLSVALTLAAVVSPVMPPPVVPPVSAIWMLAATLFAAAGHVAAVARPIVVVAAAAAPPPAGGGGAAGAGPLGFSFKAPAAARRLSVR